MKKRLIQVTQQDIDNGVPNDCYNCAVALALKREYKTDDVEVTAPDYYDVSLCIGREELNINTYDEKDILDFIDKFDKQMNKGDVTLTPFIFEVVEWK